MNWNKPRNDTDDITVHRAIKIFMITVVHRFGKLEERLHMLSRDIENIFLKEEPNQPYENKNYKVWDEKFIAKSKKIMDLKS